MRPMRNVLAAAAVLAVGALSFTGAPVQAAEKVCKLEIAGNDMMQYDKKELKVAADCTTVELTLKHTGKLPAQAMGHNWVLVKTADLNAVANAGMAAGLKNDHVPPGDKRVIAHTKVIGGGETTSVTFPTSLLKKGEDYSFVCTFPGHSALMKGKFIFG
ncbi:MAG TPA: azurin [Steroidobacteraceae bacterium]